MHKKIYIQRLFQENPKEKSGHPTSAILELLAMLVAMVTKKNSTLKNTFAT